jgi:hypothetical protein
MTSTLVDLDLGRIEIWKRNSLCTNKITINETVHIYFQLLAILANSELAGLISVLTVYLLTFRE